jgi:hypothetical protein
VQVIIRQIATDTQTISKDIKVTSLILEHDPDRPHDIKVFYCFKCRNGIFKYNGHISWIIPGDVPAIIPSFHECRDCKTQYMLVKVI